MSSRPPPPMAMAPSSWSSLPSNILSKISKILNTDVDTLRLRSVCSSWRSTLPPRLRPSFFPLKLPPLWNKACRPRALYLLGYSTLYRLFPPKIGPRPGDPSDGWLFRALEVNPNRFSLLSPLLPVKADYSPGTIPELLNLLEYRITEICNCYGISCRDEDGVVTDLLGFTIGVGNIAVFWNDFELVVFVLLMDSSGRFWKYGDKEWTNIDLMGHGISDLLVCNGKCYSITDKGVLFEFDSSLKLKLIPMAPIPVSSFDRTVNYLLEYKSELYLVLRRYEEISSSDDDDESGNWEDKLDSKFRLKIFKKCNRNWKQLNSLEDEFFLSCEDVSIGFAAKDFKFSNANCVHVAISNVLGFSHFIRRHSNYGVCELEKMKDNIFMNWPPPRWLFSDWFCKSYGLMMEKWRLFYIDDSRQVWYLLGYSDLFYRFYATWWSKQMKLLLMINQYFVDSTFVNSC